MKRDPAGFWSAKEVAIWSILPSFDVHLGQLLLDAVLELQADPQQVSDAPGEDLGLPPSRGRQ